MYSEETDENYEREVESHLRISKHLLGWPSIRETGNRQQLKR